MMKECNSILMLVSTLFIALHMLGSINTVSPDKLWCWQCDTVNIPGNPCKPIAQPSTTRCSLLDNDTRPPICYEVYHKGIIDKRGCLLETDEVTGMGCSKPDSKDDEATVKCYCSTTLCNYGTLTKTRTTSTTEVNKGSVRLCQMSHWICFALPVLVIWTSGRTAFAIGHHHFY